MREDMRSGVRHSRSPLAAGTLSSSEPKNATGLTRVSHHHSWGTPTTSGSPKTRLVSARRQRQDSVRTRLPRARTRPAPKLPEVLAERRGGSASSPAGDAARRLAADDSVRRGRGPPWRLGMHRGDLLDLSVSEPITRTGPVERKAIGAAFAADGACRGRYPSARPARRRSSASCRHRLARARHAINP
jgi:hypothetical protein